MVENPSDISEVTQSGLEYYFKYKGHAFSVSRKISEEGGTITYSGFVYPTYKGSMSSLAQYFDEGQPYEEIPYVNFGMEESERAAYAPILSRLYAILADKYLNLDDIFDDVIAPF